jgi:hypothetical protein
LGSERESVKWRPVIGGALHFLQCSSGKRRPLRAGRGPTRELPGAAGFAGDLPLHLYLRIGPLIMMVILHWGLPWIFPLVFLSRILARPHGSGRSGGGRSRRGLGIQSVPSAQGGLSGESSAQISIGRTFHHLPSDEPGIFHDGRREKRETRARSPMSLMSGTLRTRMSTIQIRPR